MDLAMSTVDYPPRERFDAWSDLVSRTLVPVKVTAADRATHAGRIMMDQFDQIGVYSVSSSSCSSHRTPRLINQSDPEVVHVMLVTCGAASLAQNGTESTLGPGDLAIHVSWRPFVVHTVAADSSHVSGISAFIPRRQLPIHINTLEQLTAHMIPGNDGTGAMVARTLTSLTQLPPVPPADRTRLSCALVDILTVSLGTLAGLNGNLGGENVNRALVTAVKAFIQQHLDDPELTPATIATAHHVSTRTLHRLFESQDGTVADLIRRGRLERCLRDLRDPALRHRQVQEIAARWGFRSPSHFNRQCRARTGMTPGLYRQTHLMTAVQRENQQVPDQHEA